MLQTDASDTLPLLTSALARCGLSLRGSGVWHSVTLFGIIPQGEGRDAMLSVGGLMALAPVSNLLQRRIFGYFFRPSSRSAKFSWLSGPRSFPLFNAGLPDP